MIGIVASRLAERHRRPVVLIALDGETREGIGAQYRGLRPARRAHRLRGAPAALRRPSRRRRPGDRARRAWRSSPRHSAHTPSTCSRRGQVRSSGSTPWSAAMSSGWSSPRSCRRWRRSAGATRLSRCWSRTRPSAMCGRWAKASTRASRSSPAARARVRLRSERRAAAGRGGRAGRGDVRARGQRVEWRQRAPAGAAPRAGRAERPLEELDRRAAVSSDGGSVRGAEKSSGLSA